MMELNKSPDKIVLIYEGLFSRQKHLKCVYIYIYIYREREREREIFFFLERQGAYFNKGPPVYSWVYTYITFHNLSIIMMGL